MTSLDERIEVDGAHSHAFLNPAGYVYRIGCFASAPGVRVSGPPSEEFSWFSGHAWEVAVCGACTTHLGWRFSREAARFFALILARLREGPSTA
ncbi:MAG TPA: cereblon family protein [Polyangiaceae bacterium]|nr:cereblon family protein [Polyangiaceae bacterium]